MKTDDKTAELPGLPVAKRRGRPPKGEALSNAERQRRHREKAKQAGVCPCCGQPMPAIMGEMK